MSWCNIRQFLWRPKVPSLVDGDDDADDLGKDMWYVLPHGRGVSPNRTLVHHPAHLIIIMMIWYDDQYDDVDDDDWWRDPMYNEDNVGDIGQPLCSVAHLWKNYTPAKKLRICKKIAHMCQQKYLLYNTHHFYLYTQSTIGYTICKNIARVQNCPDITLLIVSKKWKGEKSLKKNSTY